MSSTLTYDSQLIDEALMTAGIAIASDQVSPLAVLQNQNGDSEALVIHQDTELYHVVREPLSQSGWNMYGVGARLISAALVSASRAYAIGNYDSGLNPTAEQGIIRTLTNGHWDEATVQFNVNTLFSGWDGTVWAYANIGLQPVICQLSNGSWQTVVKLSEFSATVFSVAGSADDFWVVDAEGNMTNYASNPQTLPYADSPVAVVSSSNGNIWMIDESGELYELSGDQWQPFANSPGAFSWLAADPQGNLWGIYQAPSQSQLMLGFMDQTDGWQPVTTLPTTLTANASVGADGSVLIIDANGAGWILTGGPSGTWQRLITPTGMTGSTFAGQVSEVVTGQDAQQNWHAFFAQNGTIYQIDLNEAGWTTPVSVGAAGSQIGLTNSQDSGELIGYGASADGNFLVFMDPGNGQFTANEFPVPDDLTNVATNLTAINDQMWITTAVINESLCQVWGSKDAPMTYPGEAAVGFAAVTDAADSNNNWTQMQQVIRLPWVQAEAGLPYSVVLDNYGNVYMVCDLKLNPIAGISSGYYNVIAGGNVSALQGVTSAGAIMDQSGMARIYACDSFYQTWVLRQTGTTGDPTNPWTWSQWHPLGDNCIQLVNGPGPLQTTELFSISGDQTLYVIDQDAVTGAWNSKLIKRPAGASEDLDQLTLYKTELAVVDENGTPASNLQVNITASEPALLWIEGVAYQLAAGQSVTGATNLMGKLRISTPAMALHTSPFTATIIGEAAGPTIYPPQNVHEFLAGTRTLGIGRTFTKDGNAIINATDYNGDPFTGFAGIAQNQYVPDAASVIMQLAQAQPTSTLFGPTRIKADPATSSAPDSPLSFWDNLWNDLVHYVEDIFCAIRNGVFKVVSAAYDAVSGIVTVVVKFVGDTINRTFQFLVQTYHDIANALHTAFMWIEAKVDEVIDWLKVLFDWSAILYTQEVFAFYVQQSILLLQAFVQDGEMLANKFFQHLEGDVTSWFDTLKQDLGVSTLNDTASNASSSSQINFNGLQFTSGILMFGTELNWLLEKVESYLFGSSNDSLNPIQIVQTAAQEFWNVSQPAWTDLDNALGNLKNFIQNAVNQPGDFKQVEVADLINAIEEVILAALQFADAIVQAFLTLINAALGYADGVMNYNIDIPLISKLYEKYGGQPITALNVFSLLLAAPVTIGYKLATGNRYLFTEDQVQSITGQSPLTAAELPSPATDPALLEAFAWCSGAVILIGALFDTGLDAFQATPPLGLQILDIVYPTVLQVFGWPSGVPFTEIPTDTTSERWGFANWLIGWAPIPLNIGLLLAGELKSSVLRYMDPAGKGILTGIGLVNLGVGAVASGLGQKDGSVSAAGVAANILGPMPNLFQWLRIDAVEEESEELTYYIKLLIDFFTGVGTAVALFAQGNEANSNEAGLRHEPSLAVV